MAWWIVAGVVAAAVCGVVLFLRTYPAFGGKAGPDALRRFRLSPHYRNGRFVNPGGTELPMSGKDIVGVFYEFAKGSPNRKPKEPIPVDTLLPRDIERNTENRITWFGHSTLLLELDGKKLLLDPMLGIAPSPFPRLGGKRYGGKVPIEAEELPELDAVLVSHDHYDHLDYGTVSKLKHKTKRFVVPLGVAAHLERWGVPPERISEHDWGDETEFAGIRFACAPAIHFSGRLPGGRFTTLWCSWAIRGRTANVYFGGDSGYGSHFADIGERYGPFDLTLMECGQYDERWAPIHMMPEQTVQAHLDVRGGVLLPIHWGAFTLALHDWTDPAERVTKAAAERNVRLAIPRIGEPVAIGSGRVPTDPWWR